MKSDIINIDNQGSGFDKALEETKKVAAYKGLDHKQSLRLSLFTEEMLSMVRIVTGEMQAAFWIENEDLRFELNLTTNTVMDKEKRRQLLASASSRKNEAAGSFLGKLRDAFEDAMLSEADNAQYDLPNDVHADLTGRVYEDTNQEWDKSERSVLLSLADDVKISIRGGKVHMTIVKDFAG